jgi:hypothetical protein
MMKSAQGHLRSAVCHRLPRDYLQSRGTEIPEAVVISDRVRFYVLDLFGNYFEFIKMKSV